MNVDAGGRLHYVPLHHRGLQHRMAAIARWIGEASPTALVIDVSVEVTVLARLFGVPVFVMAQPGVRSDGPHQLAYDMAEAVIAPWPQVADVLLNPAAMRPEKTTWVGAISRFTEPVSDPRPSRSKRVLVLNGTGGDGPSEAMLDAAAKATPSWEWTVLDRARGTWVDDPWPAICAADVLVSHAGQNAVAEIAAARKPAVIIAQDRPFDEQRMTASALASLGLPVVVSDGWPDAARWRSELEAANRLPGHAWSRWNDGLGASRAAEAIATLADGFAPADVRPDPGLVPA